MTWIVNNISRLMTVSGVLTLTMIYAAIAPEAALQSNFGESLSGPVASIVVRNWAALIALVGGMLIYGARNPAVRPLVLTVAGASKLVFIGLVLSQGSRFLSQQVGVAVVIDAIWVAVFAAYLMAAGREPAPASRSTR
jgi:hypothetical protein